MVALGDVYVRRGLGVKRQGEELVWLRSKSQRRFCVRKRW